MIHWLVTTRGDQLSSHIETNYITRHRYNSSIHHQTRFNERTSERVSALLYFDLLEIANTYYPKSNNDILYIKVIHGKYTRIFNVYEYEIDEHCWTDFDISIQNMDSLYEF